MGETKLAERINALDGLEDDAGLEDDDFEEDGAIDFILFVFFFLFFAGGEYVTVICDSINSSEHFVNSLIKKKEELDVCFTCFDGGASCYASDPRGYG
ncbi:hypothetical protein RHMOL_Rhmol05G0079900 [Rhododendron molle]|uniref:Uncharacterized protein n=1 Tax=Rhododendron molle TaxID=49168 RepID=A0ACC0NMU0_RHOML|nr:hypothetical protein RHMOL_Rhmol05G0079900 [Rhododendron molle]